MENARKDLSEAVTQAQKELSKLAESPEGPDGPSPERADEPSVGVEEDEKGSEDTTPSASTPPVGAAPPSNDATPEASTSQPQTLLSRLQATLPPNLVSSVQDKLPESLKHARATSLSAVDFAALRGTIAGELARVQGSSEELLHRVQGQSEELLQRVQAGDLLQRGEGLLKQVQGGGEEFFREAGEFLRDAVRVVPPDASDGGAGVVWDGTDVWMIPTYTTSTPTEGASGAPGEKGKGKERRSLDSVRAATRAQAMLTQLRHDPQVVRADPTANPTEREAFAAWVAREIDAKGGVDGIVWSKKIEDEKSDRPELATLLETLGKPCVMLRTVMAHMTPQCHPRWIRLPSGHGISSGFTKSSVRRSGGEHYCKVCNLYIGLICTNHCFQARQRVKRTSAGKMTKTKLPLLPRR